VQKAKRSARELALNILYQVDGAGVPVDEALSAAVDQSTLDDDGKKFVELLVRGTLGKVEEIDAKLRDLSPDWPLERQAAVDRNILRLAAFEIEEVASVPSVVAINEAVELAKKFSTAESGKFINGVLATYLRRLANKTEEDEVGSTDT
jgi:transcription antitermination protein NusB